MLIKLPHQIYVEWKKASPTIVQATILSITIPNSYISFPFSGKRPLPYTKGCSNTNKHGRKA